MAKSFEDLVLAKLDNLLRVLTVSVTNGMKQTDQIALLNRVGFPPREIADLLGTTGNTVNVALSNLRKGKGKKGKGKRSSKRS
jgi:DNA-directed RNA polymerase specialized sigma24 family protein